MQWSEMCYVLQGQFWVLQISDSSESPSQSLSTPDGSQERSLIRTPAPHVTGHVLQLDQAVQLLTTAKQKKNGLNLCL